MQMRAFLAFVLLTLAGLGCQRESTPELIQVLDFAPREAEVGDMLEIAGSGFPQGKTAHVAFRGALHRPGQPSLSGAEIEAEGVVTSAQSIELTYTEAMEALFCGSGDRASHTTFEGDVEVSFPALAHGAPPISSTLHRVSVDFRPPLVKSAALEARGKEGERALLFMGIHPAAQLPGSGGLLVESVDPRSPAAQAGILPSDVLSSFNGVRVSSPGDAVPPGHASVATLGIRRLGAALPGEDLREVRLDGFKPDAPTDLFAASLILFGVALAIALFVSPYAEVLRWVGLRLGVSSSKTPFLSALRANLPGRLLVAGVSAVFVAIPFRTSILTTDLDVAVVFVVMVAALVTIRALTAGQRGSRVRRGFQAAAHLLSAELPAGLAIICIVMMTGSLRLQEIIRAQGGAPWDWYAFRNPVLFALFFLFMSTTLAAEHADPPEGPLPALELGIKGPPLRDRAFLFALEWAHLSVLSGMAAALFLGGWQVPGLAPGEQEAHVWLEIAGSALFLLKAWLLILAALSLRATLPRLRLADRMSICWRWIIPLSVSAVVFTIGWVAWSPTRAMQILVSALTFAMFCLLALAVVHRVRLGVRAPNAEPHLNPFL